MLTKLSIKNFKRFDEVEIELGSPVVFVGPNNSGKTTALQALSLWYLGLKKWQEKRGTEEIPSKRPGVPIGRRDFVSTPIPSANLLWRDLHVRESSRNRGKAVATKNVLIEIEVEGVAESEWKCGLEFDYANEESFHCRPRRGTEVSRQPIPKEAFDTRVSFLHPMSGLADREFAKEPGEIAFLLGQGRTAEVLRNLCRQVRSAEHTGERQWKELVETIDELFGVRLDEPTFIPERAEITLSYLDRRGTRLDLSSSGRGVQQTLLLLAYLTLHPRSVLLLDEPDAHLEILRQRQIYKVLNDTATKQKSQIIVASHSEVILNEAADRDLVIAFVGRPHRIDDRGSQALKALKEIGFEQYYESEQRGWVLYLEGSTDLAILQEFAAILGHVAKEDLSSPFVQYVENQPQKARDHFRGLREAKRDLVGILLCDRLDRSLQPTVELAEVMWRRREIENYLCQPDTLLAFAASMATEQEPGPLFEASATERYKQVMQGCIEELVPPIALQNLSDEWWRETKATDGFLDRLFAEFYSRLGLQNLMRKSNYHRLATFVPLELIDPEIAEVLDAIHHQASLAKPVT